MSRKIIAVTNCEDRLKERFGYYKLVNSFKFFHPDIPIYNWGDEDSARIIRDNPGFSLVSFMPIVMLEAMQKYEADMVIKLDADCIILDRLSEIIDNHDEEVFSVRNDPDCVGDRDERHNRPKELWNLPNHMYVNCGCVATTSKNFLLEWLSLNRYVVEKYGGVKEFWQCEQNTMNIIFHSGKYKTKILDPKDGDLYYGTSANMRSDGQCDLKHILNEWGVNSWQSWKDIKYNKNDNKFYLYNKQIKICHQAGGGNPNTAVKCDLSMFNNETRLVIENIINYDHRT